MKLKEGFNKQVIDDYNKKVLQKIDTVCKDLNIDKDKFSPVDKNRKKTYNWSF